MAQLARQAPARLRRVGPAWRTVEIVQVLGRHARLALADAVRGRLGPGRDPARRERGAIHLRDALADLGPTFIKLGQVLSTRPDLVPPALERALSSLQDGAPAVGTEEIRAAISAEFGRSPDEAFALFEPVPLAAASIGQVHAAVLHDGREVVVKIRRPGVDAAIEDDLSVLGHLGRMASARFSPFRRIDVSGFVEEFAETIRNELDYLAEGSNADRLRADLTFLGVHVPEVLWAYTTSGVLTLERIRGAKIDDLEQLDAMAVDRPALAMTLARVYLTMVFANGFFHADPHPGNLFVEEGGRLAMVDFGMVGTVSEEVRRSLIEILIALTTGDMARSAAALHKLGIAPNDVEEDRFVVEVERLTEASIKVPVGEIRIGPLLADLMTVSRHHHLRFPRELALLVKTVVMCEGLAAALDPDFALPRALIAFSGRHLPDR